MPRAFARMICAAGLVGGCLLWLPLAALAEPALEYLDSAQWTFNQDCAVRNDTICTTLPYGLQVWDAVDPAAPVLLSDMYFHGERGLSIDWIDDLLAITTQSGLLKLVDISDPTAPALLNEISGFGAYSDVVFQKRGEQRLAFVVGSAGLKSLDLSNPALPVTLDNLALAGSASSVCLKGDSLAVLARAFGLHMVDAADPGNLSLLGSAPMSNGTLYNTYADGTLAAVAARNDGFYLFDISNPAAPSQLANVIPNHGTGNLTVQDVVIVDTLLYVSTNQSGILVYDLSIPASPVLLGFDPTAYYSTVDMAYANGRVYMTHWGFVMDGVHTIDVSDPAHPASLGHTQAWDFTRFADSQDGLIYTAMGHTGSFVHSFDPGTGFHYRGGFFVLNSWGLDAVGDLVYIASTAEGLVIADWSDPEGATEVGRLNVGTCRAVEVGGGVAYLAVYQGGLFTVDVSDPGIPVLLDECGSALETVALCVRGSLVATADRNGGANFWDVSDPTQITLLANFPTTDKVLDVEILGDIAYVCASANGLYVLDISAPTQPQVIDTVAGYAKACQAEAGFLHLATGAGVTTYDISDPAHPLAMATYDSTGDPQAIVVAARTLFVSDYSGLLALYYNDPTPVDEPPSWAGMASVVNYPNPFNPQTTIHFTQPVAGFCQLEIIDVTGRLIATLDEGYHDAGAYSLTWLARDEQGRDLPSGIYFARLMGGNAQAVGKLLLLR